ncbi:hypothetical protein [Pseudomonas guariconensis]|uniref:hypothetical protein n=1 Tax=Pseudomonas guariconensis TaxID=1288410 RepID=UPI0018ABDAB0|nr:hypothetical protein [Pseudomonas guariconensis]MBF8756175.1 hypothetical protein [Pseudomonas guariconensis]
MKLPIFKYLKRFGSRSVSPHADEFKVRRGVTSPRFSLDPHVDRTLYTWEDINERGLYLVHAVSLQKYHWGDLSKMPAEEALKNWDVFSTSLIAVDKANFSWHPEAGQPGWATQLATRVGLLLEVPPQNILGAFNRDVWFPTHANDTRYELAQRILSGEGKRGYKVKGGYQKIVPPTALLSSGGAYNEVLVVGRPGTCIHFSPTGNVKVLGIAYSFYNSRGTRHEREDWALISKLKRKNPGLKVEVV